MWYKWSQEQFEEWETPPDQWGLSRSHVEDMIARVKGASGIGSSYQDEDQRDITDDDLALWAENDFEIYNRYLSKLPENINAWDVFKAYRSGLLPSYISPPEKTKALDISDVPEVPVDGLFWEPYKYNHLDQASLLKLLQVAKTRVTPTNNPIVSDARHQIFLASFKDPDILNKLGIRQTDLNKMLRSWTNLPAKSLSLEKQINDGASNLTTEWTGISNSSYLSTMNIDARDIDGFFKDIKVSGDNDAWNDSRGESLRKWILRAVLAIDTHIKYDDLSFEVVDVIHHNEFKNPRGLYMSPSKMIQIRESHPHTVSHEMGHYLDYKWTEDLTSMNTPVAFSDATFNVDKVFRDEESKQFYHLFQEFVMDISERSEISSEYYQRRHEVFARFIAKFVDWVHKKAGNWEWGESHYRDNFSEFHFIRFIKILQMKSYLDARRVTND